MATDRARKLIEALSRARGHLAMAEVAAEGDLFKAEMLSAAGALLEALELSNGVVYHRKPAERRPDAPAPGPTGSPGEAA